MAVLATLVLLAGLVAAWHASGRLARSDRAVILAVAVCLVVAFAWLALTRHWESVLMRLIPGDDFVFFQDLPLFLALLLWLMLCLRRLQGFVRAMTGLLAAFFAAYALAVVTGPLWLPLYASRLQGSVQTAGSFQSTSWSCGPAALAEALRRKGISTSEREVALLAASSPLRGTTDWGLLRAAHRLGVPAARLLRPAFSADLLTAPKPALAEWYLGQGVAHMIVITGVQGDRVSVTDPLEGDQTYTRDQFEAQWMGGLLLLP